MNFTTDNGSAIEVTRVADGFDLHLRNPEGDTIATVVVPDFSNVFAGAEWRPVK